MKLYGVWFTNNGLTFCHYWRTRQRAERDIKAVKEQINGKCSLIEYDCTVVKETEW